MKTTENIFDDTAIIVSDGCCVQLANNPALDDVTFEIKKGKSPCKIIMFKKSSNY